MTDASVTVYGLPNCDACRKARRWLTERGVHFVFIDVRADGIPPARAAGWVRALGRDAVINRRSTTWRSIPAAEREDLDDAGAARLVLEHPTLLKRPLIERGETVIAGFQPERLAREL